MLLRFCKACVWHTDLDMTIYCLFPKCVKLQKLKEGRILIPDKKCKTCRKKSKCNRSKLTDACILHSPKEGRFCQKCGSRSIVEEHHIFFGPNRKRSDREGLTVDLCPECHRTGKNSAHASKDFTDYLHKLGQIVYESDYGEGSFLKEFGRNYL